MGRVLGGYQRRTNTHLSPEVWDPGQAFPYCMTLGREWMNELQRRGRRRTEEKKVTDHMDPSFFFFWQLTRNASGFNLWYWFPSIPWPVPGNLVSSLSERGFGMKSIRMIWEKGQERSLKARTILCPYCRAIGQESQSCEQWGKNRKRQTQSELPLRTWHAATRTCRQERAWWAQQELSQLSCAEGL